MTNLKAGIYKFELTVYDNASHYDIDTMTVSLENTGISPKQLQFSKMFWLITDAIWVESWLEIDAFNTYVPSNSAFEIFIKRETSFDWRQIIPFSQNTADSGYVYSLSTTANPALRIYELPDAFNRDKPDVKIVF